MNSHGIAETRLRQLYKMLQRCYVFDARHRLHHRIIARRRIDPRHDAGAARLEAVDVETLQRTRVLSRGLIARPVSCTGFGGTAPGDDADTHPARTCPARYRHHFHARPQSGLNGRILPDSVAGFVDTTLFIVMSGRETWRCRSWRSEAGRRSNIDLALEQVGLTAQADTAVAGCSAECASAWVGGRAMRAPRLLFLDEPASALDRAARASAGLAQHLADQRRCRGVEQPRHGGGEELCAVLTVIDRGRVVFSAPSTNCEGSRRPPSIRC